MRIEAIAGVPDRLTLIANLTAPFKRSAVRFKKGGGNQFYPYFDVDTLTDRLNDATGNCWDMTIENWEWREKMLAAYGHMDIPGLGRRAGVGVQEHTSGAGNEMGADLIKGVRADLIKNCLIAFGVGSQVRQMDPFPVDPYHKDNKDRIRVYLDNYFPRAPHTDPRPEVAEGLRVPTGPTSAEAIAIGAAVVGLTAPLEVKCACGEIVGSPFCECKKSSSELRQVPTIAQIPAAAPELPTMRWVGNKLTTVKAVANG